MNDSTARDTLESVKADLAERLGRLCSHFPRDDFDALIDRMARIQLKYDRRVYNGPFVRSIGTLFGDIDAFS